MKIKVPVGTYNGLTLKFSSGNGGDLYVKIKVPEHKIFTRRGNDIIIDEKYPLPRQYWEVILKFQHFMAKYH